MNLFLIIFWIAGITSLTLLGSYYARRYNKPDLLIGLYVTFILTSQILAVKIVSFNLIYKEFYAPSAILIFSVTFLITDIVNEKFGRQEVHRMILISFISQIAMVFFLWLGTELPPAPFWSMHDAWKNIFSFIPRITIASWIAFLISENLDAYIFDLLKKITKGRHLWIRNVFSSLPSLFLDSIIFISIAFIGVMPILPLITGQVVIKWLVCIVNIPFMYLNRWILKSKNN